VGKDGPSDEESLSGSRFLLSFLTLKNFACSTSNGPTRINWWGHYLCGLLLGLSNLLAHRCGLTLTLVAVRGHDAVRSGLTVDRLTLALELLAALSGSDVHDYSKGLVSLCLDVFTLHG